MIVLKINIHINNIDTTKLQKKLGISQKEKYLSFKKGNSYNMEEKP